MIHSKDLSIFRNATDLAGLGWEMPEPLFDPVLFRGGTLAIVANAGVGKSVLTLDAVRAAITGQQFLLWPYCGPPSKVLLIDGELTRPILKDRLCKMGLDKQSALTFLCYEDFLEHTGGLIDLNLVQNQVLMEEAVKHFKPDILVLDPFSMLTWPTTDISDVTSVQMFLKFLLKVKKLCAVIVVFHPPKDGRPTIAGTFKQEAIFDTIFILEGNDQVEDAMDDSCDQDESTKSLRLYIKKCRYVNVKPKIFGLSMVEKNGVLDFTIETGLTNEEKVRALASDGKSSKEISSELGITMRQVQRLKKTKSKKFYQATQDNSDGA